MKDRIKSLMESQHMTQNTFANFIGLSPATLSSIFNGRTNPTLATVEAIKSKLPLISLDWLVSGNGPMFRKEQSVENDGQEAVQNPPSETQLLFADEPVVSVPRSQEQIQRQFASQKQKNNLAFDMKNFDKSSRTITEIRVFFSDQTYESFVPKK